jgi:endonuclease/exonuclease/phosphatase family metal-dependent hydrolase
MRTVSALALVSLSAAGCVTDIGGDDDLDFSGVCFADGAKCDNALVENAGPAMLSFDELLQLSPMVGRRASGHYDIDGASSELVEKVNTLLTTPYVNNKAFKAGSRPHRPKHEIGNTVDVAFWNIERGQQLPAIQDVFRAAEDSGARAQLFATRIKPDARTGSAKAELDKQLDALATVDVVVLNEVDRGLKRSGYADVVAELGKTLQMNWTWGAEFIEVDPFHLGTENFQREDFLDADAATGQLIDNGTIPESELANQVAEASAETAVDGTRVNGLHGNAILSRYPILKSRVIPLETVCWDWNAGERQGKSIIQEGKDIVAEKVFLEKSQRQIRHGGRSVLIADLMVPGLTAKGTSLEFVPGVRGEVLTVVTAHIEAKSSPSCRARQMKEVLELIKDIKNPVVFGGDLNTFGGDGRPTTIESLLKSKFGNWQWIARQAIGRLAPYSGWVFTSLDIINWVRLKDDPTGINIPLFLPNPERGLFDAVENVTFDDFARFDFRGDSKRTVNGTAKTLANSNQRDSKGFKTTSSLQRTLGIGDVTFVGKWKLDWIFARGYQRSPRDTKASYRMAPHFPRTLEELQLATIDPATGTPERLSDHAPLTVQLPVRDVCTEGSTCSGDTDGALEFSDVTWEDANTEPTN